MSATCTSSCPRYSTSDSRRCASSPSCSAPARRALPFRVCSARRTWSRGSRCCGWLAQARSAPPRAGMSSAPSSSKIGNRSGSIASMTSSSSSSSTFTSGARGAAAVVSDAGLAMAACATGVCGAAAGTVASRSRSAKPETGRSSRRSARASPSASFRSCSSCSRRQSGSFRNPAANWCSRRRTSSAAAVKMRACAGVPCASDWVCCSALSSARAMSDSPWNPTVAELPASAWAQPTVESATRWFISSAHSLISVARRRDHSSASFRYTL